MSRIGLAMIAGAWALAPQIAAAQATTGTSAGPSQPITIVYSDKGPSRMSDLPMGIHRIPDSDVIISGHQKGSVFGALFGLAGMLAVSSANASAGTVAVHNVEDDLRFDVAAKAAEMTRAILADEKYKNLYAFSAQSSATPAGVQMTVTPYVVVSLIGETDARPYIVLKTTLSAGEPRVKKYFCCEGKPLPLSGDSSLTANNGERFKALLTEELDTAINVMLKDRAQPFERDKQNKFAVRALFPFMGKPFKVNGTSLGKYKDDTVFEIRGGGTFSGVHVADPTVLEINPPKTK